MTEIVLSMSDQMYGELERRASEHDRTPSEEAKRLLAEVLGAERAKCWAATDAIYDRLLQTGREFDDSAELLREERDR